MKVLFYLALFVSMIFAVMGNGCNAKFNYDAEKKLCLTERPIHGECPAGSQYSVNINKCVQGARG